MTLSESENSGCTWHLGVNIDDPEDIKAFEHSMKNPDMSPERLVFFREAREVWERCY